MKARPGDERQNACGGRRRMDRGRGVPAGSGDVVVRDRNAGGVQHARSCVNKLGGGRHWAGGLRRRGRGVQYYDPMGRCSMCVSLRQC